MALDTSFRHWNRPVADNAERAAVEARSQGRVSLRLRVGVTGHRLIAKDDEAAAIDAVRKALDQIEERRRSGTATTPVELTVVTSLAEGADRLVAWEAVLRGLSLEVVLPLPRENYLADFPSEESRAEFDALLGQAAVTELSATGRREQAYERAGRAVVDRSDVLLALWDGRAARGRGGTAEIVAYARQHRVPVLRIPVGRPGHGPPRRSPIDDEGVPDMLGPLSDDAFIGLDQFNAGSLRSRGSHRQPALLPPHLAMALPPRVQQFVDYAQPYFQRAELTARLSQRLFLRLTRMLYSLAAIAVVVVATQIIFFGTNPKIVWVEVVALVAVVVTLMVGRRAGWHDRWIAARYLAERIRCGVFAEATGAADGPASGGVGGRHLDVPDPDANREWAERAFREICWRASRPAVTEAEVPALRRLLLEAWIDDQIDYHQGASRRLSKRQRQLTSLAVLLFGVSALVALLHSMHLLQWHSEPDVWGYLSVVIPAIGAAQSGYAAQREYARLAERSRLMVFRLGQARNLVEDSNRLASLQRATRSTELLMRSETADWYDVVRLHDFEVPS